MANPTSIRAATLALPASVGSPGADASGSAGELVVLFDDHGIVRRRSLQQFDDREVRPGSR